MKTRFYIMLITVLLSKTVVSQHDTLRFESYKKYTDYVTQTYKTSYPNLTFFKPKILGTPTNPYDRFKGDTLDSANTALTYLSLINELDISNFQSHNKINRQYITDQMFQGLSDNVVPVSVTLVEYDDFKDSVVVTGSGRWLNGQFVNQGPPNFYPFVKKVLFASSSLNQGIKGTAVTFRFDQSLFLSNMNDSEISSLEIDFNSNSGFEPLLAGQNTLVNYSTIGEKIITIRKWYKTQFLYSHFKFVLLANEGENRNGANSSFSGCATEPQLPGAGPFAISTNKLGDYVTGNYAVWFSTCNREKKIRKPYIISAGFNPGNGKQLVSNGLANMLNFVVNNVTISFSNGGWNGDWRGLFYETYNGGYNKRFSPVEASQCNEGSDNGNKYLDRLRDEGYDIVILMYDNGTDYAVHNAALFMELIEKINIEKTANGYYFENVVSGYSAGGIASKLALSLMESRYKQGIGPHPHTKMWVSVETENQGANVPLGLQHFFNFQKNPAHSMPSVLGLNDIQLLADGINQIVAGLSYGYNNNPTANELTLYMASANNGKHQDRINLENIFASIPQNSSNGYPEFCRRVGASQGSGLGYTTPHSQPEILDTRLKFDLGGSFTTNSFPSSCGGSYTWYLPSAEKRTTAKWWGANNGSNIFDGTVIMDWRTTVAPMSCFVFAGDCYCGGPYTAGSYIVIGEQHVAKPNTTTNYDDVPSSSLSAHIECYTQSAYPFYNNWFAGVGFASADQKLHAFAPTVSCLDLHDPVTGLPLNNFSSPNALNLFNVSKTPAGQLTPESNLRYGFPHLTYPNNHYVVTPYDAVFAIGNNNGTYSDNVTPKPNNQLHVEDPQSMMGDYLARVEVAPENLFLSNQTIGQTAAYGSGYTGGYKAEFEARSNIIAGSTTNSGTNIYSLYNNQNQLSPNGDFQVSQSTKAILHSGEQVELLPGVSVGAGAELDSYIKPYLCSNDLYRESRTGAKTYSEKSEAAENELSNRTDMNRSILKDKGVKIYPNPSNGLFRVANYSEFGTSDVSVIDLTGRVVHKSKLINNQVNELDLNVLPDGIYFVLINNGKTQEKLKVIISK